MPSLRVRFSMTVVGMGMDNKTNGWALRTMEFLDNDDENVYEFPPQFRDLSHHDKLFALPAAITARKNMPKRHATRQFRITLPEAVARIYSDDDDNPVFHGDPLDVFVGESDAASSLDAVITSSTSRSISAVVKEAVLAATNVAASASSDQAPRSLSSIVKDAVVSKFNPKLHNASSWISIFERECERLKIDNSRYWEVIRLFFGGSRGTLVFFAPQYDPEHFVGVLARIIYKKLLENRLEYCCCSLSIPIHRRLLHRLRPVQDQHAHLV